MPREESDYLQDILVAAQGARTHVRELTFSEFTQSHLHRNALQWELTVMGEAATHVSLDTKVAYPEIPWSQMTGMRNRLVHRYFRIDLDIVWSVVREDIPALIAQMTPMVRPEAD